MRVYPLQKIYIACSDWRFDWTSGEINIVIDMWNQGTHISDIAQRVQRNNRETFMLLYSLAEEKKIKKRTGGILGTRKSFERSMRDEI